MARQKSRKGDASIFEVLLGAPWQVSVFLAIVVFAVLRWVIPAQFNSSALIPLGMMVSWVAPFAAIGLLIIAAISFFVHKKKTDTFPSAAKKTSFNKLQPAELFIKSSTTDFGESSAKAASANKTQHIEWSIELLRELEWNRFEKLTAEYFRIRGKRVETVSYGADGGVDVRIYDHGSSVPECVIQCKAWNSMVGIKPVRELFGVMAHETAGKGIFMTTSTFSEDAKQFATEHSDKLFLIDGQKFISMILKLPEEKKAKLLAFATEGNYTTPTCASCGIKMVWRAKGGFWGCKNYPKCKTTLRVANA